jgi:ATP-binding cassette subfamily B protein
MTVIAIALASAVSVIFLFLSMKTVLKTLEHGNTSLTISENLTALAILLAAAIAYSALKGLEFAVPEAIGFQAVNRLRLSLHKHMSGMSARQIQHRSRGSLILRLTGDLTMLRTWLSRGLGRGTIAGISMLACILIVATISPKLAGVITICLFSGIIASLAIGRRLQKVTARVRRKRSLLTSNIDEQVHGLATIQTSGRFNGELSRLARQSESLTASLVKEARLRGLLRSAASASGWIAMCAIIAVGGFDIANGALDLSSIMVAIVATRLLQGYVSTLGLVYEYWCRAEVSRRKLEDFLNSSSRLLADPALEHLRHSRAPIRFESLRVDGALQDITALVPAGWHVAIVGPSGSGKTTLLHSIARMVKPQDGSVFIGDQDLESCQIASVFRKIGLVSPDLPLLRGTIRRNLCYRKPSAGDAEISALLTRCGLKPLVDSFSDGLDHWITEDGRNISVGERQRLALARAMMGSPPILLLDEPIALLDRKNRQIFRRIIAQYAGTILHVTEDPDDIAIADLVWTMENGRLVSVEAPQTYLNRMRQQPDAIHPLFSLVG